MTSGDRLPEPVRRYLAHAVPSGEAGVPGVRLTMSGRIKVGIWLPLTATQRCDGKSFICSRLGLYYLGAATPGAPKAMTTSWGAPKTRPSISRSISVSPRTGGF